MDIQIEDRRTHAVVAVAGKIDAVTCTELEESLNQLTDAGQNRLLINFKEVSYISSAGLRVLLSTTKKVFGKGSLSLCLLSKDVENIITMAGFEQFMTIYDDMETAETAIANEA